MKSTISASLRKPAPESVEELIAIQQRVQKVVKQVMKCTVNVRVGGGQGSGVIVTKDGYVLTAAHVSGEPGKRISLVFPDGKTVRGRTLGLNHAADAGLVKITDPGEWPFAELGSDNSVEQGDWCVSLGHPGGYHRGRNPVVRLGRIVVKKDTMLQSDCTLVGGDSGGPLFDLEGRVIGIHSRIGPSNTWNFHVPIGAFHKDWDRFVSEDNFGQPPQAGGPILGVGGENHPNGARITGVAPGLPAEAAALKVGDVISSFDGKAVKGFNGLFELVQKKKPGDKVAIEVLRDGKTLKKTIVLAARE
ncbi:MAG: S1C family serine protease [Planctomycetota bacterium]|nr:S1C family serine protease [Planctomycetota bacterium]